MSLKEFIENKLWSGFDYIKLLLFFYFGIVFDLDSVFIIYWLEVKKMLIFFINVRILVISISFN